MNWATSLLFLLIKYTGKDQQTHSAPEKPIHPHIPWLQGYSHKYRVMKSGLQTPAATLQFKEKSEDRGMNMLFSQSEHPLEKSAGTAQPTLETYQQNAAQYRWWTEKCEVYFAFFMNQVSSAY